MKNQSIIKSTVLAVAMASFVIACKQPNAADTSKAATTTSTTMGSTRIVYVNTDTLLTKYDYYKAVMKEIEAKSFKLDNELKNKGTLFQNKVALFQQQVQKGGLSQDVAQTRQAELQKEQQEIMAYKDQQAQGLQKEQSMKTDELLTKIQAYLKTYSKEGNFQMVMGYSKGGGVLYADETLDITHKVLDGLNKEYAALNPKK